jgi:hypothetical protein
MGRLVEGTLHASVSLNLLLLALYAEKFWVFRGMSGALDVPVLQQFLFLGAVSALTTSAVESRELGEGIALACLVGTCISLILYSYAGSVAKGNLALLILALPAASLASSLLVGAEGREEER